MPRAGFRSAAISGGSDINLIGAVEFSLCFG
jgi:hypothetical protein